MNTDTEEVGHVVDDANIEMFCDSDFETVARYSLPTGNKILKIWRGQTGPEPKIENIGAIQERFPLSIDLPNIGQVPQGWAARRLTTLKSAGWNWFGFHTLLWKARAESSRQEPNVSSLDRSQPHHGSDPCERHRQPERKTHWASSSRLSLLVSSIPYSAGSLRCRRLLYRWSLVGGLTRRQHE